jgi:cobalamin biosynthesis protein CbiD
MLAWILKTKAENFGYSMGTMADAAGEAAVAAILETRRALAIHITPEEIREWIDEGRM